MNEVKLDIGCGIAKFPGFIGIDKVEEPGVDIVLDFLKEPLPFDDNSVDEIFCADVIEHITYAEMIILMNEIHRVIKSNGIIKINTVYGIRGWREHPPHVRPIYANQFNYFTKKLSENSSFEHMRRADGIKVIFDVSSKSKGGNLFFMLRPIK